MNLSKKERIYILLLLVAVIALSYEPQLSPGCGDCTEWVDNGCGLSGCEESEMFQTRTCTGDIFSDEKPVMAGQGDEIIPLSPPKGVQFSLGDVPPECIKKCVVHEECQEEEEEEPEEEYTGSDDGINPPLPPEEEEIIIELPKFPDLKLNVNIDDLSKELHPGDILPINVILENKGDLNPIDVNLKCQLTHKNTVQLTIEETHTLNKEKNLTREINLPETLTPGGYILECFVLYEDYSDFQINTIIISTPPTINEESPLTMSLVEITFLVLTLITILIIIIIFIKRKKKTKTRKNGNRKNRTTKTTHRKHKKSGSRHKNVRRRK